MIHEAASLLNRAANEKEGRVGGVGMLHLCRNLEFVDLVTSKAHLKSFRCSNLLDL
jgi:hypothetical protein